MKESYHLEIDAETGRSGLPDENIKIYQVDAPDKVKRASNANPASAAQAEVRERHSQHPSYLTQRSQAGAQ